MLVICNKVKICKLQCKHSDLHEPVGFPLCTSEVECTLSGRIYMSTCVPITKEWDE